MDMSLYIPHIESRGRYEVIGQVLLLPVRSKGEFIAEFSKNYYCLILVFWLLIFTFVN